MTIETKELRPSERLLWLWLGKAFLGSNVLGLIFLFVALANGTGLTLPYIGGLLLAAIPGCIGTFLYFKSIRYSIEKDYVIVAYGVLWKVRRSVPLDKITNIDVRQGPVERLLGFGQVWIFTPSTGSMMPEEMLLGVVAPHDIKQFIIDACKRDKQNVQEASRQPASSAVGDEQTMLLKEILTTLKSIKESLDRK